MGGLLIALLFQRLDSAVLSFGAAFGAAAVTVLGLWFAPSPAMALFAGILVLGVTIGGIQSAVPSLAPHIYPRRLLATGLGWAGSVARLGGISAPPIGGWAIAEGYSMGAVFGLLAVPILICAVLSRFLDGRNADAPGALDRPLPASGRA